MKLRIQQIAVGWWWGTYGDNSYKVLSLSLSGGVLRKNGGKRAAK